MASFISHASVAAAVGIILCIAATCSAYGDIPFAGGTGEPNDPYQIATAEQLISIGSDPNLLDRHFILVDDVDLDPNLPGRLIFNCAVIAPALETFYTNYPTAPFVGRFDGNGFAIRHLVIVSERNSIGLFGDVGVGGCVANLRISGAKVTGGSYTGLLVGRSYGTLEGCTCLGVVKGRGRTGGLVGYSSSHGMVRACDAQGHVEGESSTGGLIGRNAGRVKGCASRVTVVSKNSWVGGLIGYNEGYMGEDVRECRSIAHVSGQNYVGGLIGYNYGVIDSCYAMGSVRGNAVIGGLVGGNDYHRILYCYCAATVHGNSKVGALVGTNERGCTFLSYWDDEVANVHESAGGRARSTEQLRRADTFRGWGFGEAWAIVEDVNYPCLRWENIEQAVPLRDEPGYSGGTGTSDDPYHIACSEDLIRMGYYKHDWSRYFKLTADIDMSGVDPHVLSPVGTSMLAFTGYLDGAGHVITNATLLHPQEDCVGLLGCVATPKPSSAIKDPRVRGVTSQPGSAISNLHLHEARVAGRRYVGLLAGYTQSVITSCSVHGNVSGNSCVGGLAGYSRGTVDSCRSEVTALGESNTGGLLGQNEGTVSLSCATGSVRGGDGVGGLVGDNLGTIQSCYSTSSAVGSSACGGLVGSTSGWICFSYSAGPVSGENAVGGLVGEQVSGLTRLCYWDRQASGVTRGGAGLGRSTAEMMDARSYRGWGYAGTWTIDGSRDYPRFEWEGRSGAPLSDPPPTYSGGNGTAEDPFRLSSADDLVRVAYCPSHYASHFTVTQDIDLSWVDPNEIMPIGLPDVPFVGFFQGNGHVIRGLTCAWPGQSNVGFFCSIGDGTGRGVVSNLNLSDAAVVGVYSSGVLAGRSSGSISGCSIVGTIAGSDWTGGIVGFNGSSGSISGCSIVGTIAGGDWTGGIVGSNEGTVRSCTFAGTVQGERWIGALAGKNSGMIISSGSQGSVSGDQWVGGLAGRNDRGRIVASSSSADVEGRQHVGGLVGYNTCSWTAPIMGWVNGAPATTDLIVACYASGKAAAESTVGGLVGYNEEGIRCCYAAGSVRGLTTVGGAIGENRGNLALCYSAARVTQDVGERPPASEPAVGGLIGHHSEIRPQLPDPLTSCLWDVEASGTLKGAGNWDADPNGLAGLVTTAMRSFDTYQDAAWLGPVKMWTIEEGLDYPRLVWERQPGTPICDPIDGMHAGSGDPQDPYQIASAYHLGLLGEDAFLLTRDFILTTDLDLDPNLPGNRIFEKAVIAPSAYDIGGVPPAQFEGTLDGAGHVIRHLHVVQGYGPSAAFLGSIGVHGLVKNLGLDDVLVEGTEQVAALAGLNNGSISRCFSSGLVGTRETSRYPRAGGLVGANAGRIEDCHSTCGINGRNGSGGIASSSSGMIRNSYFAGWVGPGGGGVCGLGDVSGIISCFWDRQFSGALSSVYGVDGPDLALMGSSTSQMQTATTFIDAGWDFESVWMICEGADYPRLQWENVACGDEPTAGDQ